MKWWPETCLPGDMIRVRVGAIWHYGIFISDEEVIEFGPPPTIISTEKPDFAVLSVGIDDFSAGGIIERAIPDRWEQKRRFSPEQTIALARSRVGERGYDILHNNCEHFAFSCFFGEHRSVQEETLRQKWDKRPILDVFVMRIPEQLTMDTVFPPERAEYIAAAGNENVKRERYAVWKLLEQGIKRSFYLRMEDLQFKCKSGKWSCDRFYFSLSHSHGAVAAAVSNAPVGVDLESVDAFLKKYTDRSLLQRMARKVCTQNELSAIREPLDFLSVWTAKECLYKCYGSKGFFSRKIDSGSEKHLTVDVELPEVYQLSVCGENLNAVRVFRQDGEDLSLLSVRKDY